MPDGQPVPSGFGAKLGQAFRAIVRQSQTTEQQTNANPDGVPGAPPTVNGISVSAANGHHVVTITDQNPGIRRGINYWVERDTNPQFTNPHVIDLGQSRNHQEFLGSGSYYWRGYSSYGSSPISKPAYHGSAAQPMPVDAGGGIGPAPPVLSQGSGTGAAAQGLVGPGPVPVRDKAQNNWGNQGSTRGGFNSVTPFPSGSGMVTPGGSGGGSTSGSALLVDTHANRLANYPSVKYPLNTQFYENDRTTTYWVQNATGTVNVAGTAVTWATGDHFINTGTGFTAAQWPAGTPITINGVIRRVATVNSPTSITLQSTGGTVTGGTYSVASGRWVYLNGQYEDMYGNLPTDLGENDYAGALGFLFFDTTHWRMFQWAATGGGPAVSSPGWLRGPGELPTASIHILPFGGGQMATGWTVCNGAAGTVTQDDASILALTKPNFAAGAYPKGGTTGTYSPTPNAAVAPTISGATDIGNANIPATNTGSALANVTASTTTVQSGTGATVVSGIGQSGHDHTVSVADSGHAHNLSAVTTSLSGGDPVSNVIVPFYMKR